MKTLMVLTYLGTLNTVYSSARPQIMGSSIVSSLPHFLKTVVPDVTFDTTIVDSDRSAAQGRQIVGGQEKGRVEMKGRGGYTGGRLGGRDGTRGSRGGPRGERGDCSMVRCYYCKEPSYTKHQCPSERKISERCTRL